MEKHGAAMTKLSSLIPENYAFSRHTFKTVGSNMCKDDNNLPLFHSVPDSIIDDNAMDVQHSSIENKTKENVKSGFRLGENDLFSLISGKSNNGINKCLLPAWTDSSKFSFSDVQKNFSENSFKNKIQIPEVNASETASFNTNSSLQSEDENSSSSIEEIFCPEQDEFDDIKKRYAARHVLHLDSNETSLTQSKNSFSDKKCASNNLNFQKSPEPKQQVVTPQKIDRMMPELLPTVICLDDDEESVQSPIETKYEIIDVASSPEMPTLTPFSECEEILKIKQECCSEDEETEKLVCKESELVCSTNSIRQPQVLLKRISLEQCLPLSEIDNKIPLDNSPILSKIVNTYEGPEIEEIEGIRFFQFRSKQEMVVFNQSPEESGIDLDMIVPTKTTDITQIKGWRNKYFASDAELNSFQTDCKEPDTCPDITSESFDFGCDKKDDKIFKNSDASNDKFPVRDKCKIDPKNESILPSKTDCLKLDSKLQQSDSQIISTVKNCSKIGKNPLSAFISDNLDNFLAKSSELNVNHLQKINPNIKPIPPDAGILSIGKLRILDKPKPFINYFLPKKVHSGGIKDSLASIRRLSKSPELLIIDSGSDDDIPVAQLNSFKRRGPMLNSSILGKCIKRRRSETSSDHSQRLVLRLTKESKGASEGYKISDISCKKSDESSVTTTLSSSSSSSSSSSPSSSVSSSSESEEELPEEFKVLSDCTLPVIQKTVYIKEEEPKLLSDFIKNLNLLGTSKDVAMLVESNQSYFAEGQVLEQKRCDEALNALLSNKELTELKQKPKSRRKLKTWQKYLPKKLSTSQKLKISKTNEKAEIITSKDITIDDSNRGKRSIRLPARYLDSAVLAAGSEWVSPIFVDDPKKSRKQLLDVLDKLKSVSCKQAETVLPFSISGENDTIALKSPDQPEGKPVLGKQGKTNNSIIKETSTKKNKSNKHVFLQKSLKKIKRTAKVQSKMVNEELSSDSSENTDSDKPLKSLFESSFDNFDYYLPACVCLPCSRTAHFNLSKKQFCCLNDHSKVKGETIGNNLNNHYTFCHVDNEPVRLSIPCKEDDSHDSLLEISEAVINNSIRASEEIKTALYNESREFSTVDSINAKINSDASNVTVSSIQKNSPLSDKILKPQLLNADTKISQNSLQKVNSTLDFQSNLNKSSFLITNKGLCSIVNPIISPASSINSTASVKSSITPQNGNFNPTFPLMTSKNLTNPSYKFLTGAPKNQLVQLPVTPGNNNQQYIILVPVKTANSVNSVTGPNLPNTLPIMKNRLPAPIDPLVTQKSSIMIIPSMKERSNCINSSTVSESSYVFHQTQNKSLNEVPLSVVQKSTDTVSLKISDKSPNVCVPLCPESTQTSSLTVDVMSNGLTKAVLTSSQSVNETSSTIPIKISNIPATTSPTEEIEILDSHNKDSSLLPSSYHNYVKKGQTKSRRRKSPLRKRKVFDRSDMDVDIETVDYKFDPCAELRFSTSSPTSLYNFSGDDSDTAFNVGLETSNSTDKLKIVQERKRRFILKRNFEILKSTSEYFKDANSSLDVLNRALFSIKQYNKKEACLKLVKHRLRIHNTRLLGKLALCLHGIKDSHVRNFAKKQVIKNLAHDWVRQTRLKNISPVPASRQTKQGKKSVSKLPSLKNKDDPVVDYEKHIENNMETKNLVENVQSESDFANPTQLDSLKTNNEDISSLSCNNEKSTSVETLQDESNKHFLDYEMEIDGLMDFEIAEEPQTDLDILEKFQTNFSTESELFSEKDFINSNNKTLKRNLRENSEKTDEIDIVDDIEKPNSKKDDSLSTSDLKKTMNSNLISPPKAAGTSSEDVFSEDEPLVIDLSDDENPIPEQTQIQAVANSPAKICNETKDSKLKKFPGLIPLHADEKFEDFENDLCFKTAMEIKRYLNTESAKLGSATLSQLAQNKLIGAKKKTLNLTNTNNSHQLTATESATASISIASPIDENKNESSNDTSEETNLDGHLLQERVNSSSSSSNSNDSQSSKMSNEIKSISTLDTAFSQLKKQCINDDIQILDELEKDTKLNTSLHYIPEEIILDSDDDVT